jgi:CRISPR-associated protein Csx14
MKNILLAVTGLSPQVITETLFALHQSKKTVDAVHIITTRDGKEMIYATLLSGKKGRYYQYLDEYGINPSSIDFSHRNIHVISDEHGIEIPDIGSELDNERFLAIANERYKSEKIPSVRGSILASDESTLVYSEPRFDVFVWICLS